MSHGEEDDENFEYSLCTFCYMLNQQPSRPFLLMVKSCSTIKKFAKSLFDAKTILARTRKLKGTCSCTPRILHLTPLFGIMAVYGWV